MMQRAVFAGPSSWTEVNLEQLKEDLGFKHPIIGVHVRHGDGCLHGRGSHSSTFRLNVSTFCGNTSGA
jgi:hypothetical protein